MVDALEGWDDFLVMGHDDDGSLVLAGHLVKDTHHGQRTLAVQRRGGMSGERKADMANHCPSK